jgi:iron-sulfur cluster insertion protein
MSSLGSALVFTKNAALKVYELIQEEGNLDLNLRIFVEGGGCSGFKYGFKFDKEIQADDIVIEKKIGEEEEGEAQEDEGSEGGGLGSIKVKLLIDSLSFQYLTGAEIDYREDVGGARFVIRNPNAQTTCGCGSSFSA